VATENYQATKADSSNADGCRDNEFLVMGKTRSCEQGVKSVDNLHFSVCSSSTSIPSVLDKGIVEFWQKNTRIALQKRER
jgi:hypothetical protein